MKLETFFKKFELFADAPNAVVKMRKLILQLAVQGQLKSQADESGFPQVRLDSLGSWAQGCGFPVAEQGHADRPILFSKVSDMNLPGNEREILKTNNTIDEAAAKRLRIKVHPPGTVIFPKIGGAIATNKRRVLVRPTAIDNNCSGLIPNKSCSTHWIFLVLSAIDFAEYQSGTSVPAVNQGALGEIKVSLPPLAEQKRIVAKVDELMALCDRLALQQQERETRHAALARASLARFADAPTPANLQFIFHPSYTIAPADLRKSILTLAVQGKLVPQDPNDEPAELLCAQLQKLTSGAKQKTNSISEIKLPFEIPACWKLTHLDTVTKVFSGNAFQSGDFQKESGIRVIKITNVGVRDFKETHEFLPVGFEQRFPNFLVQDGDILMALTRPYILDGLKVARCPKSYNGALANQRVGAIQTAKANDISDFLYLYLCSEFVLEYVIEKSRTLNQPNLNIPDLRCLPFPLPPLAEQRRIVAKVDELMKLVDALETQLATSRATAANLLAALVAELTNKG